MIWRVKDIQWGKNTLQKLDIHIQKNEIGPLDYNTQKLTQSGLMNLNVRLETIKLLEENIWKKLLSIGLGNDFLDMTPKVQATKAEINKQDYIKLKSFLYSKRNNQQN